MKQTNFKLSGVIFSLILFAVLLIAPKSAYATTCSVPISGNFTPSASCSFGLTTDGIDAGSGSSNTAVLTLNSGVTITIQAGQTIGFGQISLNGGAIILNSTASLKAAPIWVQNQDGDPYPYAANPTYIIQTTQPANYSRRDILSTLSVADCNDTVYNTLNECTSYPPTNLTATTASQTQINLSWTAPTTDASHTAPDSYTVYYCTGASCTPSTAITGITSTSYSHTGLTCGTTYGYYVVAVNTGGTSGPSNTAYATTSSCYAQGYYQGYYYAQGYYQGYYSCFTAGSKVLMANGKTKNIEDVAPGDKVVSYNLATGIYTIETVVRKDTHIQNPVGYYIINNILKVTGNHNVWIVNKGIWGRIDTLKIGDSLFGSNGQTIKITSIQKIGGIYTVYNLALNGPDHNYYVEGFLVHNVWKN
jgi:hypothetical protein